jgi:hypothetical protein
MLIQEWEHHREGARGKAEPEHSLPQIHAPPPISNHLKRLWAQIRSPG